MAEKPARECCEEWGTSYSIFPGAELIKMCFQTEGFTERRKAENVFEINFCVRGRFETSFSTTEWITLTPGDMAVSLYDGSGPAKTWSSFPLGYYEGLVLMVQLEEANRWMRQHMGVFAVDLSKLKDALLRHRWYWLGNAGPRCEHVFRELYECSSYSDSAYLQLKVAELFMLLIQTNTTESHSDYYPKTQVDVVKHIRDHLVSQMTAHTSIEELTEEHNISVSQFRKVFRAVYGKPVYQYLLEYRLEQAAIELTCTAKPITDIAFELGFSSPSKFAENFKRRYGVTPKQYRALK